MRENNAQYFVTDTLRSKSSFNRSKWNVLKETLSFLEERLLDTEIPLKRFENLTKEEWEALYRLKDDSSIIMIQMSLSTL